MCVEWGGSGALLVLCESDVRECVLVRVFKYRVAFCKTEITFTGPWSVGTCFPQDLPLYREFLLSILYTVYGVS